MHFMAVTIPITINEISKLGNVHPIFNFHLFDIYKLNESVFVNKLFSVVLSLQYLL